MGCTGCNRAKLPRLVAEARRGIIGWTVNQRNLFLHLKRWRKPEDVGVGDTIQHVAEYFKADQFSAWLAKWGLDCGCEDERAYWNEKMPYR